MASTRSMLEQISGNLNESLGVREFDLRPQLSPVSSGKDVGRRPVRNFGKVDIHQVIPDPDQPRVEFTSEAIERLAESIRDKGQLSPIRVRWSEDLSKWIIIAGERRWRATKHAGLPTIECYFHEGELSRSDVLEQQLIENLLREDLKPIEEAKAFSALIEMNGWTGKQVAEALRIPESKVSRTLALLRLPEDIQDQVEAGTLAARSAYEISRIPDDETRRTLSRQASEGRLPHAQATNLVRQHRGKPRGIVRAVKQTFVSEGGWKVTVSANSAGTYEEIEQALHDALEEVRHRIENGVKLF